MDEFEKVEKLRQRANVTYEEAKEALKQSEGDLLDAMIYLEGQGKTGSKGQTSRSTVYEEQTAYVDVRDAVESNKNKSERTIGQKIKYLCHLIWLKCKNNKFVVERKNEKIVSLPVWVLILALIVSFWTVGIVLIVGLFLDCRYEIVGPDSFNVVNNTLDKAGEVVDKVKDEFDKL
ncbi:MAG: hypothetical protein K6E98_11040 [Lachnospiraceae bacterium]|nr:hypothetical protein [Lachnospiraceae bacterium]